MLQNDFIDIFIEKKTQNATKCHMPFLIKINGILSDRLQEKERKGNRQILWYQSQIVQ